MSERHCINPNAHHLRTCGTPRNRADAADDLTAEQFIALLVYPESFRPCRRCRMHLVGALLCEGEKPLALTQADRELVKKWYGVTL